MFNLVPWRERKDLDRFKDEMDKLFDRFFSWTPSLKNKEGGWIPSLDVSETGKEMLVKVELPGMEAKDIDVSVAGDVLTIKGERKQESEEKDENFHRIECSYGAFSRSVRLPAEGDPDKVDASYKKGVLKIKIPKTKGQASRKIEIKTS